MWDYDSLIGKAQAYFARAEEHPRAEDDEFTLWILLAMEFLLRAPLSKVHPTLLAAPDGNSILHAAGISTPSEPKSIPTHTVIERLSHVISDFGADRQADARSLSNLRNNELHTGAAALANVSNDVWLPKFMRVAEVICTHLELDVDDLVGPEIAALGRELVDEEDKRLNQEIAERIHERRVFYDGLQPEEIAARRWPEPPVLPLTTEAIACPACTEKAPLTLDQVRVTNETIENDEFVSDLILVAREMICPVCTLKLSGTSEIKAAGLQQSYTRKQYESFYERMARDYMDDDYGND